MPKIEELITSIATEEGRTLRENAFNMGEITMKHEEDPVSSLDTTVERNIKKAVLSQMPANFIGEEYGREDNGADYTWIIDPIDGTKSMITGEFNTSLSIGVEQGGKLVAGCVYDFMRDIMYVGYNKNLQIYQGGEKVRRSVLPCYKQRIVVDGDRIKENPLVRALQGVEDIKIIEKNGSIALAMAQVAAGVYDGMVYQTANRWNEWDIAGGLYLLNCSGVALNLDFEPIDHKVPQQGIIGVNRNLLPTLVMASYIRQPTS